MQAAANDRRLHRSPGRARLVPAAGSNRFTRRPVDLLGFGTAPVTDRTLQGVACLQPGQARAWPLVSDQRRHKGSAVDGGRRPFLAETRSAIDGGGVPPHTQRAKPGPVPGRSPYMFFGHSVIDEVVTVGSKRCGRRRRDARGIPAAACVKLQGRDPGRLAPRGAPQSRGDTPSTTDRIRVSRRCPGGDVPPG